MKKLFSLFLLTTLGSLAHDHIEVGVDISDSNRLALDGPGFQLAMYVPPGEPFSGYMPFFPGDWFASELTFSTEVNALEPATGANPRIEIISIDGPPGGSLGFWEVGATAPTWEQFTGWTNTPGDMLSFMVILNGDNHVHGRAFTMDTPGEYTVVLQAVDAVGLFMPSANMTITFVAQPPPPLMLTIEAENATLSFTSRNNLDYDVQSCTNLNHGVWFNQTTIFGDGTAKNHTISIFGLPHAFYRLVEY